MKSSFFHLLVWIFICAVVIIGQIFWYVVISNKSIAVADLQRQIDTKKETAERISSARTALAEIAGDESVVQSYFVPENGVVPFIENLETRVRAQSATMKVLSVSVGDAKKKPSLLFSVTVNGTFDSVMRSIGVIEYAPYDISVSKLSIVKDSKNNWHADIEFIVGSILPNPVTSKPT